jgi:hypothetical protein
MMDLQRKLKVLVISTEGSDRHQTILELFAHPTMMSTFEQPVFSPSVSSRALRNRMEFVRIANQAGLIPQQEWEVLQVAMTSGEYDRDPGKLFDCLNDVPVAEGRRGSKSDVKLHYCKEVRDTKFCCDEWCMAGVGARDSYGVGSFFMFVSIARFGTRPRR